MSMTARRITTHEATIKTATVAVKTLTISGKQVTLSVFRQLEERALFDQDLDYLGVPWGRVNYCPKRCTYEIDYREERPCDRHLHVVWQQGDRLYQCRVCFLASQDLHWCTDKDHPDHFEMVSLWRQRYEELSQLDQLFIAV